MIVAADGEPVRLASDLNGRVGPVGGIAQKVSAARQGGADILLVHEDEAEAAQQEAGARLRVEAVANIEEAISLLEG